MRCNFADAASLSLPNSPPDLRPSIMSVDSAAPKPRVIVLCFDGTANQYDETVRHPLYLLSPPPF